MRYDDFLKAALFILSIALIVSLYIFFSRRSLINQHIEQTKKSVAMKLKYQDISYELEDFRVANKKYLENQNNDQIHHLKSVHSQIQALALNQFNEEMTNRPLVKKDFTTYQYAKNSSLILVGIYILFAFLYGFFRH